MKIQDGGCRGVEFHLSSNARREWIGITSIVYLQTTSGLNIESRMDVDYFLLGCVYVL